MEQHIHPMYDDDVAHFHIDTDSRAISHTTAEKLVLIQGDHNSEIYTFDIPRFNDGHDMMLCNLVQIHFINIDANNSQNVSSGVYEVLDMQLDPLDPNTCICSWIISNEATPFVGRLTFALRFACMEGSRCTYVWNTQIFDGVPVQKSYNNSDLIMSEYTDILEKWYWEFVNTTTAGVNVIADAKDKAIAEIETILFNRGGISVSEEQPTDSRIAIWIKPSDPLGTIRIHNLDTDDFDTVTLDTIKGEKGDKGDKGDPGDPGDPTTFIVQDIYGYSEDKVPSQAALKTKFEADNQSFSDIASRLESLEGNSVDGLQERLYSIEGNVGENLQERLESLEGNSVDGLQERLSTIETDITTTQGLVGSAGTRIVSVEESVGLIEEDVTELNSAVFYDDNGEKKSLITAALENGNQAGMLASQTAQVLDMDLTRPTDPKSKRLDDLTDDVRILQFSGNFNTEKYDETNARIDTLETKVDTDIGSLESLRTEFQEFVTGHNVTHDNMDERVHELSNRVDTISLYNTRISVLEGAVQELTETVSRLLSYHND